MFLAPCLPCRRQPHNAPHEHARRRQPDLPADADFFRQIVSGVIKAQLQIDPAIDGALTDAWPVTRIDATLRAILRAGAFELTRRRDIPPKVVIAEYVDIGKAFYADDAAGMVNAVLDRIASGLPPV